MALHLYLVQAKNLVVILKSFSSLTPHIQSISSPSECIWAPNTCHHYHSEHLIPAVILITGLL